MLKHKIKKKNLSGFIFSNELKNFWWLEQLSHMEMKEGLSTTFSAYDTPQVDYELEQGFANSFCRGADSKYFQLFRPYGLCWCCAKAATDNL